MAEFYTNAATYGSKILVRGYKGDGTPFFDKVDFQPTFYVRAKGESKYKTLDRVNVEEIQPGTIRECRDFIKRYEDVEGFPIYGNTNYVVQYIGSKWTEQVKWDKDFLRILTIDIETAAENGFPDIKKADQEVLLITLLDNKTKRITTFTAREYKKEPATNVTIVNCVSEEDLLLKFIEHISKRYPDVITGWNVEWFDIPYLTKRIEVILGENAVKRLSPFGLVNLKEVNRGGSEPEVTYDWVGVSILDYLELYKKFTYSSQESYTLDHIAFVELESEKLDWSEHDTFRDFYTNDFTKFVDYNIHDTVLVDALEDKMALIALIITMAYEAKITYNAVFSPVAMWDSLIYNYLLKQNVVIPRQKYSSKSEQYEGAYVKDPIVGMHNWVVSFDATALYPSIIQAYNISPETFVGMDRRITVDSLLDRDDTLVLDDRYSICANGAMFKRDQIGVFGALVDYFADKRRAAKNLMLKKEQELVNVKNALDGSSSPMYSGMGVSQLNDLKKELTKEISSLNNQQMATKIALNSLYGAVGNQYFRYFNIEIARAITLTGQYIIREVSHRVNDKLNEICETKNYDYVFYNDTDSQYLRLEKLVNKYFPNKPVKKTVEWLDKVCEDRLSKFIDEYCKDLQVYTNAYRDKINFKREAIADRGLWAGKKRYILRMHDSEGVKYETPKIKIMGFEIIKSSTPAVVKDMLREAVDVVLDGTEADIHKYVRESKKKFKEFPLESIAFPRSCNGLAKWSDKGSIYGSSTPIHVRGALLYNHHLKRLDVTSKYEQIKEGEKIKFIYLKMPNPIRENVISFTVEIPKEFGLDKYVDYDMMFEKVFTNNLDNVIIPMGWKSEPVASFAEWI